jgi:hypothetical protein
LSKNPPPGVKHELRINERSHTVLIIVCHALEWYTIRIYIVTWADLEEEGEEKFAEQIGQVTS